jgi:hypothetical protein
MRYPLIFTYIALLLTREVASGQYFETGEDPASLKWLQIKTNHFTVIYPEKYSKGGIAYARSFDNAYLKLVSLFPEKKFRIPVVIHNYTINSNGYVAWAPRRIELYPTPEQNTIPLATEKQLTIHELAHVFQMESLNNGFSKIMTLFFGEQFTGIVASLLPQWFLEGDAVFAESALTESGRGRSPSFLKQFKAITVENSNLYKYDKIINGSFKDYVPDYYESGYQMVSWAMAKYDHQIWNKVLNYTSDQPFTLNPVNISLSQNIGLKKKTLYKETFDTLKTLWTKDISENNATGYESLNPEKRGKYINYYSPLFIRPDSIIAIKTSLSDPPEFVLIDPTKKTEKVLHTPGRMYPWVLSYSNGKIVWVETQPDPRWANRSYSVIKLLDIKSNLVTRLSRKTRYLSASISPDGKTVAVSENTTDNINSIVFINVSTGTILYSVPSPENAYLQRPQWSENGKEITVISLTEEGEGIISYSFITRKWDVLIKAGRDDLQSTLLRNDSLFFISSRSGTDNIYVETAGKKITKLTRSRFGTIDLSLSRNKVYFSDYSSSGNSICSTNLTGYSVKPVESTSSSTFLINRINLKTQAADRESGNVYTPEPYRKWQHLFRFHSWMPFYADIETIKSDPASVRPGISIMTQNQLSTLISSVGYEYSRENNHVFHSRITWKGWYPVFESQIDYGNDPLIDHHGESVENPLTINPDLRFSNTVFVPLTFSSGEFSEYLQPSFKADYRNKYIYIREDGTYDYGQTIMSGRLYFSNSYRFALRDIYPRWAQAIDFSYLFAPFDKNIYGTSISMKTSFYFPGFLPNNGIKFRYQIERQKPVKYLMGNLIDFPRGYKNLYAKELDFFSVDYAMPLAYPDFNISSLLYLKRIRSSLFYDYATGPGNSIYQNTSAGIVPLSNQNSKESLKSFGIELMTDFHVLRIPFMISGGVQASWKSINVNPSFALLFSIDLFGMSIGRNPM